MQVRTDDEVYRVDAVWLGPPRATFPWRARYAAYGVGLLVMVAVMFVQRRLGISLGFFSVAWALLVTVAVTRFVGRRIDSDRPLVEWLVLFAHELRGPRRRTATVGGALTVSHVRVRELGPSGPAGAGTGAVAPRRPEPEGFGPPATTTVGAPVRHRPRTRPGDAARRYAPVRVRSGRLDRPETPGEDRGSPPRRR